MCSFFRPSSNLRTEHIVLFASFRISFPVSQVISFFLLLKFIRLCYHAGHLPCVFMFWSSWCCSDSAYFYILHFVPAAAAMLPNIPSLDVSMFAVCRLFELGMCLQCGSGEHIPMSFSHTISTSLQHDYSELLAIVLRF